MDVERPHNGITEMLWKDTEVSLLLAYEFLDEFCAGHLSCCIGEFEVVRFVIDKNFVA